MCSSKAPKVQQPASAAPPPQATAETFQTPDNPAGDSALLKQKKKGRSSLRINPTSSVGAGGTGLSISA